MDKSFSSFKNYWKTVRRDYWTSMPRYQWRGVLFLGFMYFCQLGLMSAINVVKIANQNIETVGKYWYFLGTGVGALSIAFALSVLRRRKNENSIRWVLGVSHLLFSGFCLALIIFFFLNKVTSDIQGGTKVFYYLMRFLIGFANSAFIGLGITWVVESVYKHLRTMSALFISLLGYSGATLSSLFTTPPHFLQEFVIKYSECHCNMYEYTFRNKSESLVNNLPDLVLGYIILIITFSMLLALTTPKISKCYHRRFLTIYSHNIILR